MGCRWTVSKRGVGANGHFAGEDQACEVAPALSDNRPDGGQEVHGVWVKVGIGSGSNAMRLSDGIDETDSRLAAHAVGLLHPRRSLGVDLWDSPLCARLRKYQKQPQQHASNLDIHTLSNEASYGQAYPLLERGSRNFITVSISGTPVRGRFYICIVLTPTSNDLLAAVDLPLLVVALPHAVDSRPGGEGELLILGSAVGDKA